MPILLCESQWFYFSNPFTRSPTAV